MYDWRTVYIDLHVCTHVPCFRLVLVVLSQYWLSHIFVLAIGCESKRTTRRGVENSGKGKCATKTDHWWIRNVTFASMEREQFTKKDLVALDCDIHVQKWNKSVISCVKSLQITCTVHCLLRKKIPLVLCGCTFSVYKITCVCMYKCTWWLHLFVVVNQPLCFIKGSFTLFWYCNKKMDWKGGYTAVLWSKVVTLCKFSNARPAVKDLNDVGFVKYDIILFTCKASKNKNKKLELYNMTVIGVSPCMIRKFRLNAKCRRKSVFRLEVQGACSGW